MEGKGNEGIKEGKRKRDRRKRKWDGEFL